jgi:hypothetical protein
MDHYDKALSQNNVSSLTPPAGSLHASGVPEYPNCQSDNYALYQNAPTREIINAIEGMGLTRDGTDFTQLLQAILSSRASVATLEDQKATTVNGGSVGSNPDTVTRDINTTVSDTDSIIISLSANQFTLAIGEYSIEAHSASSGGNQNRIFLYNVTDASDEVLGIPVFETGGSSLDVPLLGNFTVSGGNKAFELRHYVANGTGVGATMLGRPASDGKTEVYSQIKLTKIS